MNGSVHSQQSNLDQLAHVQNILNGLELSQKVKISSPNSGLIVWMRQGGMQVALTEGSKRRVFELDFSDPANSQILERLVLGVNNHSSQGLQKAMQRSMLEVGQLVAAFAKPVLNTISYSRLTELELTARDKPSDDSLELKVDIRGQKPRFIFMKNDQALSAPSPEQTIRRALNREIANVDISGPVSLQVSSSISEESLTQWLIAPYPTSMSQSLGVRKGKSHTLSVLEEILKQPLHNWKINLWQKFGHQLEELSNISLGSLPGEKVEAMRKRAVFQALVQELANLKI